MSAPEAGFALLRNAQELESAFVNSPYAKRSQDWLTGLRSALEITHFENYGGIGRYPIDADYPFVRPGWQWENTDEADTEGTAQRHIFDLLGKVEGVLPDEDWLIDGPWLIPDLQTAREVKQLTKSKDSFDIVEVAKLPNRTERPSIGLDIGYWAHGNFSLICDSAVWPLWHPPLPDDFEELAHHVKNLNGRLLFDTEAAATEFRDFYRSRNWAEVETGGSGYFNIIEVAEAG